MACAVCWQCGGDAERGRDLAGWLPETHGNQTRVQAPGSPWVCEACVHVSSRVSPVPGRPPAEGKALGGNWRNYSHLVEDGAPPTLVSASKGEKRIIRAFVTAVHERPWGAAIAESGQKHVLPFTPMNAPGKGGVVAFDDRRVTVLPGAVDLLDAMDAVLTSTATVRRGVVVGATKAEMESGEWGDAAWSLAPREVRCFEAQFGRLRGGGWFALAVWLAQRDDAAVMAAHGRP